MGMTQQQRTALGAAILILLVLVIAAVMHHSAWMKKHCVCKKTGFQQSLYPRPYAKSGAEGFSGDDDNWPQAGSFGAYADTFPYGNYADGQATFYPTFDEYNPYWTRA